MVVRRHAGSIHKLNVTLARLRTVGSETTQASRPRPLSMAARGRALPSRQELRPRQRRCDIVAKDASPRGRLPRPDAKYQEAACPRRKPPGCERTDARRRRLRASARRPRFHGGRDRRIRRRLASCTKLVDALPAGTGMAFILVQHLDPTHESMMVELLAGHTSMTVLQAADGMRLEHEHLYIIPPGTYLAVRGGALQLSHTRGAGTARVCRSIFCCIPWRRNTAAAPSAWSCPAPARMAASA